MMREKRCPSFAARNQASNIMQMRLINNLPGGVTSAMGALPITDASWQVPSRYSSSWNPWNRVDDAAVISNDFGPLPHRPGK